MHSSVCIIQKVSGLVEIDQRHIFANKLWYDSPYVINLSKSFKQGNHFKEAFVILIVIPRQDWNCILRMEVVSVR